ncbi:hypothetical protein B0H13DRAFT_7623 [Mycena leptocephala]|nr:hypothetical protein B0H13DRAFT_7623 [Mycena leptocephala]
MTSTQLYSRIPKVLCTLTAISLGDRRVHTAHARAIQSIEYLPVAVIRIFLRSLLCMPSPLPSCVIHMHAPRRSRKLCDNRRQPALERFLFFVIPGPLRQDARTCAASSPPGDRSVSFTPGDLFTVWPVFPGSRRSFNNNNSHRRDSGNTYRILSPFSRRQPDL